MSGVISPHLTTGFLIPPCWVWADRISPAPFSKQKKSRYYVFLCMPFYFCVSPTKKNTRSSVSLRFFCLEAFDQDLGKSVNQISISSGSPRQGVAFFSLELLGDQNVEVKWSGGFLYLWLVTGY